MRRMVRAPQLQAEIEAGKPLTQAAREYQIHPTSVLRWRKEPLR
jgi:hypothetical protein